MKKVDSLTEGLVNAPSSYMSSTLETKNDYDTKKNELIFDDLPGLDDWKNDKFHNLEIFDTLDNRGIYIYRNDKGMYLVVNTESLAETLLLILYWNKSKKIVNKDLFTPQLLKGVMNRVGYKLYDTKLKIIKENKKPKLFEAVKNNGVKFKTVDDDNGDAMHGVFWSPHGIDFEPLEYMEADRGHTMLYYKEPQKDWQVL